MKHLGLKMKPLCFEAQVRDSASISTEICGFLVGDVKI